MRVAIYCLILALFVPVTAGATHTNVIIQPFTAEEQDWISAHPIIRVANEIDWPPFDYNESGTPKGMAIDYISLLAKNIGFEIEFVHGYPWTELVARFQQQKIDIMPAFYKNTERKKFALYTRPYYEGKLGIFVNDDALTENLDLANKLVGMETSHGSLSLVKTLIPGVFISEVDLKNDLVRQLATRKLDAVIGNPFVIYYHAKDLQIDNIRLAGYLPITEEEQADTSLHMGVRKDWPMLHQILQKAMNNVSDKELDAIKERWTSIQIGRPINWALILHICTAVILAVLLLLWHNHRLNLKVSAKTSELKTLNESLESKVEERTKELTETNAQLNNTIAELKTLRGIIPICASCKSIRDDSGSWSQVEAYVAEHSLAEFSHGICPRCAKKLYPDYGENEPKEPLPEDSER